MPDKKRLNGLTGLSALKIISLRASLALLLISTCSVSWASETGYSTGKPDAWVTETTSPPVSVEASADAQNGVFYRLYDRQFNSIDPENRSKYTKIEYEFTKRRGVQDRSTITIDYDPSYESIVLHHIGITRGANYIDKLAHTNIQVLRTESELDELFYNGTKTITAILDDIRVGDILSYSFTRKGSNPVYGNLIEHSAYTQHHIPMASASFRALIDSSTPITIRQRDTADNINISNSVTNGVREIKWSEQNLVPLKWIDDEPQWEEISPSFTVSSISNWNQIVDWALPKYIVAQSNAVELTDVAKFIQQNYRSEKAQVGAALRWVQEEIRYFGIELGENSHNPSPPEETLARRFGDCKDVTVLLIALLNQLGIDSQPALVNSEGDLRSDKALYRLHAFDHVIVHLKLDGISHWIDPTRQNQLGALGEFYEPNYGAALIIAEGQTGLTQMSMQNSEYHMHVVEKYTVDIFNEDHANLTVTTNRKGYSAEYFRGSVNNNGLNEISDDYVDYYRDLYNYLEVAADLQYEELASNASITTEHYKLESFWSEYDDGSTGFDVIADETRRFLEAPNAPRYRKRPFSLGYPNIVTEVTVIEFNRRINRELVEETVSNDYFTYTVNVDQDEDSNTLTISHRYESHALSVPAKDILEFSKDIDRAWEISSIFVPDSGLDWDDADTEESEATQDVQASNAAQWFLQNVMGLKF